MKKRFMAVIYTLLLFICAIFLLGNIGNRHAASANYIQEVTAQPLDESLVRLIEVNVFDESDHERAPHLNSRRNEDGQSGASRIINWQTEWRADTLSVVQPRNEPVVTAPGFNIFGSSDPDKGLYMNGRALTNRSEEGFFSIFVDLSLGENIFVFSQEGQEDVTRIIYRQEEIPEPYEVMERASLLNAFPKGTEYVSAGDTVIFEVSAPIGASVTVNFNDEVLILIPEHKTPNSDSGQIYATIFRVLYKIPVHKSSDNIIDLGAPLYTMEFDGQQKELRGANIRLINENAPFYATVIVDAAWTFAGPRLTGGSNWLLLRGQRAAVRAISGGGDWVKIDTGMWIERQNVSLRMESDLISNVLSNGRYVHEEFRDSIVWEAAQYPAVRAVYGGNILRVYFAMQSDVPYIDFAGAEKGSLFFYEKRNGIYNGAPYYAFIIRDGVNIEGFYTSFGNGEFALNIRRRRTLTEGDLPLYGFKFVIDPGHGGRDPGALGPMGTDLAEKDINLINATNLARELELLGAAVRLTRTQDVFLTLMERVEISRAAKPDMFISIHADSTVETTDATNIHGISFWYRNPNSKPLAEHLISELHGINPMTTRHTRANQANFFVCRPVWTPSVIVEASFMNNIWDFSWMINAENQRVLAEGLARAIVAYFHQALPIY